ncbi:hypothetical protein P8452_29675 [Trifolium repens]|nr:hypothetical protein P8452_29675 [Trifolium repens]
MFRRETQVTTQSPLGRGNELEKNRAGFHNSQKWWLLDCLFLYKKCTVDGFKNCPNYVNKCARKHHQ